MESIIKIIVAETLVLVALILVDLVLIGLVVEALVLGVGWVVTDGLVLSVGLVVAGVVNRLAVVWLSVIDDDGLVGWKIIGKTSVVCVRTLVQILVLVCLHSRKYYNGSYLYHFKLFFSNSSDKQIIHCFSSKIYLSLFSFI